jgi:hypothetical protein
LGLFRPFNARLDDIDEGCSPDSCPERYKLYLPLLRIASQRLFCSSRMA